MKIIYLHIGYLLNFKWFVIVKFRVTFAILSKKFPGFGKSLMSSVDEKQFVMNINYITSNVLYFILLYIIII